MIITLLYYIYFNYGGTLLLILQHTIFLCLMNCIAAFPYHTKILFLCIFFYICSIISEYMQVFCYTIFKKKKYYF